MTPLKVAVNMIYVICWIDHSLVFKMSTALRTSSFEFLVSTIKIIFEFICFYKMDIKTIQILLRILQLFILPNYQIKKISEINTYFVQVRLFYYMNIHNMVVRLTFQLLGLHAQHKSNNFHISEYIYSWLMLYRAYNFCSN